MNDFGHYYKYGSRFSSAVCAVSSSLPSEVPVRGVANRDTMSFTDVEAASEKNKDDMVEAPKEKVPR